MINRDAAREIVARHVAASAGMAVDDARVRELPQGWLVPYRATGEPRAGSRGAIVNKVTGAVFDLGSAFPLERDVELYDRGYQHDHYDLVITNVRDRMRSLDVLVQLGISAAPPEYSAGTVWRVPRPLTRTQLDSSLKALPCVFGHVALYTTAEVLEQARQGKVFEFQLLRCGCGCQRGPTSRLSGPA